MAAGDNFLVFKTPEDEWGEFSNQYTAPFTYMGNRFETVEQFLYYMKAVLGRSKATAEKVLACGADSAALAKASRKQFVLESNSWEKVRSQIMRIGMRQKFLQNPELRKKLLGTGFSLLVEIPRPGFLDRILPPSEEWVRDPGKWKERNQTGKALMQVRADLRCADRIVGPDEAYYFPKSPFILQTAIGQMTLQEILMLPGARESVYAYAETAQQFMGLILADADDFINRYKFPLVTMERAIASNEADIKDALSRAKSGDDVIENVDEVNAAPEAEADGGDRSGAEAEAAFNPSLEFGQAPGQEAQPDIQPEPQPEAAAGEKLPDDIPAEGFYEFLYDLDEMMKLGII